MVSLFILGISLIQELLPGPNLERSQAAVESEPRPHPLFRAAVISGSEQLVRMHIARGRDVNARDEAGNSLLGLAASKGYLITTKLLLEAGANPALKDLKGRDPIEIARTNGFAAIVELLSQFNAEVNPVVTSLETGPTAEAGSGDEFWEEETSPSEPAGDSEYVSRAAAIEIRIAGFEYLNPDEDWNDVDADLPKYQLFAGIRKREFHVLKPELLRFFGSAIVLGTVSSEQITTLGDEGDELDEEARECISRVLNELGIEVIEGIDPEIIPSAADALSDAEFEMVEDATAYFGDLWSPVQDSYWLFMRDMGRAKLLSADDEIWLAEAIERCWISITRETCNNAHALGILCAVAEKVSNRELPLGSLLASHMDFRDEAVSAALDDSFDSDESDLPGFDTASEESALLTEDTDWQSTVQRLRHLLQQATTTTTQFNIEVRDHAFALLRGIRFSEQFVRFLIADLQSGDDVTNLASAEAIRRTLFEYEGYRNRFAEANLRLVHSIARTHSYRGLEFMELVQEGSLGLLKAVDRFDHRKGFKFSTYATWWIKQSITRAIADRARTIRIPVHMVEKINKVLSVMRGWKDDDIDIDIDADKIAEQLEIPVQKVRKLIDLSGQTSALADLTQETIESLVDDSASTAWRRIMDDELRSRANRVLRTLKHKEREIIVKRFGLDVEGEHTLEEVGQSIGVTRERIRQIEAKSLRKLRHPVRTRILKPFWEIKK